LEGSGLELASLLYRRPVDGVSDKVCDEGAEEDAGEVPKGAYRVCNVQRLRKMPLHALWPSGFAIGFGRADQQEAQILADPGAG